ncbi:MAG: transcription termination/antitermination protein NusG [Planctomycetota bacterium]|jgi:transcription antitermination factor NusG
MHTAIGVFEQSAQVCPTWDVGASHPTVTAGFCWYAIYTRSRHEKVVRQVLEDRRIESFLPLRNIVSQWKDRRKSVQKPLFPGYLFVRAQEHQLWQVTVIRGVAYVVGTGTGPVPVPDKQVEAVRSLVEGPYPAVPWPLLQKGKRVRVTAGPLAGLETFIIGRRGSTTCHIVVTVELLGRSVAAQMDPRCVEPVA